MKKSEKQENYPFNNTHRLDEGLVLKVARGYSQAVRALEYSPENLLIHIENRLAQMDHIQEKERSFFGRLSNKLSGDDPHFIRLDGMVIKQLYDGLDKETPLDIDIQKLYEIDHEELRVLYAKASEIIRVKRDENPPSVIRR